MATISTHNGKQAHQAHNRRDPRCVAKEPHIDPNGKHEIWLDETPEDAYQRMFGASVDAYNQKQTRDDRKIKDYLQSIKDSKQKNPVYELIVGVYPGEGETITEDQQYEILREYFDTWSERNPHLELIGAYYHADEQGEPHLHLDYVPWADGYKRGMEKQTGLEKALNQQGYWSSTGGKVRAGKTPMTAQICWERYENQTLEKLCNDHGITVSHPERDASPENKRQHTETELYKVQQDLAVAEKTLDDTKSETAEQYRMRLELLEQNEGLRGENQALQDDIRLGTAVVEGQRKQILSSQKAVQKAQEARRTAEKELSDVRDLVEGENVRLARVQDEISDLEDARDNVVSDFEVHNKVGQKLVDIENRVIAAPEQFDFEPIVRRHVKPKPKIMGKGYDVTDDDIKAMVADMAAEAQAVAAAKLLADVDQPAHLAYKGAYCTLSGDAVYQQVEQRRDLEKRVDALELQVSAKDAEMGRLRTAANKKIREVRAEYAPDHAMVEWFKQNCPEQVAQYEEARRAARVRGLDHQFQDTMSELQPKVKSKRRDGYEIDL